VATAGANTVADHITVLAEALKQVPGSSQAKILVRVDGAGATHDLLGHLEALNPEFICRRAYEKGLTGVSAGQQGGPPRRGRAAAPGGLDQPLPG
jgi:hypothetical protein